MNFERPPLNQEREDKIRIFETLFNETLRDKGEGIPAIEYNLPSPKEDFLKFLVENKNVLLHGSTNANLELLEPRQANDSAKKSGNKNAVYGVTDPVLPIFYAIQDRKKLQGVVESGVEIDYETGESKYKFRIPKSAQETQPWTNGVVYIFDKNQFHPEQNDNGEQSGEWTSDSPVKPIAKLGVRPEDFRYIVEYQEDPKDATKNPEHLKSGARPIIAAIGERDPNRFPKTNFEDVSNYNVSLDEGNYLDVDFYGSSSNLYREGHKNAGANSYVISPVDSMNKLSREFLDCTGLIVTGQDGETGKNISFVSHQSPQYFLSSEQEQFIKDIKERLEELKARSEEGTVDAVIVGGQYFKDDPENQNKYIQSIELLSGEFKKVLGFEPTVITGPKTVKGTYGDRDDIFYDNNNRRLYVLRPKVGDNTTRSYSPSDVNSEKDSW